MHCSLHYDLIGEGYQFWWVLILGIPLGVVGLLIFYFSKGASNPWSLWLFRVGGLVFAVAWTGFALLGTYYAYSSYRDLTAAYRDGKPQSLAGIVTDLAVYDPQHGKTTESFQVNARKFAYSPNSFDAGYQIIAAQGSAIKDGVYVRIAHVDDRIVRLETCAQGGS